MVMGRMIVVIGLAIAGAGCLVLMGLPLGRLPGDIIYRRGGSTIYIPLATSILFSVLLTCMSLFVRR